MKGATIFSCNRIGDSRKFEWDNGVACVQRAIQLIQGTHDYKAIAVVDDQTKKILLAWDEIQGWVIEP